MKKRTDAKKSGGADSVENNFQDEREIIVNVEDDALNNIEGVAKELKERGMTIKRVLPILGSITGSSSLSLSDIKNIAGVKDAEEEKKAFF